MAELRAAAHEGNLAKVQELLKQDEFKSILNIPTKRTNDFVGRTPLHLASEAGHTSVVKFLLEQGADPNVGTLTNGHTSLHLAAEEGHVDTVKLLLQHGAHKNAKTFGPKGKTPAEMANSKEVADLILNFN